MDAEKQLIAQASMDAAQNGTLAFPDIVARLMSSGFESYAVDYRRNVQTFYLPDGDSIVLDMPLARHRVAESFDVERMKQLVKWAQSKAADYSFAGFSESAKAAGCAGYLVSFPGRRVLYVGRTAETHVEHFPN